MSDEKKMFPLQSELRSSEVKTGPRSIPWEIAEEAYAEYARKWGTSQTLERLSERGGFTLGEMDEYLPGWRERVDLVLCLRDELASVKEFLKKVEHQRDRLLETEEDLFAKLEGAGKVLRSAEACIADGLHSGTGVWEKYGQAVIAEIREALGSPDSTAPRIKEAAIMTTWGELLTGPSHAYIIRRNAEEGIKVGSGGQGFVTDTGQYVTRQEAAKVAFKAGQIQGVKALLFSEDLEGGGRRSRVEPDQSEVK